MAQLAVSINSKQHSRTWRNWTRWLPLNSLEMNGLYNKLWAPKRLAPPSPPRLHSVDCKVAVGSHGQYVPTLTAIAAWRVNAAVNKAAWWPWLWAFNLDSGVRVTCDWAISVPILVFLGLSVLDLGPMYATDRRQTASSLNAPAYYGRGHNNNNNNDICNARLFC